MPFDNNSINGSMPTKSTPFFLFLSYAPQNYMAAERSREKASLGTRNAPSKAVIN